MNFPDPIRARACPFCGGVVLIDAALFVGPADYRPACGRCRGVRQAPEAIDPGGKLTLRASSRTPMPVEAVAGPLIDSLIGGRDRVHVVAAPRYSGKSTWLIYRLLKAPALLAQGKICVSERRAARAAHYAAVTGSLYYGVEALAGDRDAPLPLLYGPWLAVGFGLPNGGAAGGRNLAVYATEAEVIRADRDGLGRFAVVVVSESSRDGEEPEAALYRIMASMGRHPWLRLVVTTDRPEPAPLVRFLGQSGAVRVWTAG